MRYSPNPVNLFSTLFRRLTDASTKCSAFYSESSLRFYALLSRKWIQLSALNLEGVNMMLAVTGEVFDKLEENDETKCE